MSEVSQPVETKKRNPMTTVVLMAVGVIGIIFGVMKMSQGVHEIFGSSINDKAVESLQASDHAVAAAATEIQTAQPKFQALLNNVDKKGVAAVRQDDRADVQEVQKNFASAVENYRRAVSSLDQALETSLPDKAKEFVSGKREGLNLLAEVCDANRQIVGLILDESIAANDAYLAKITEIAAKRDANQKSAEEAIAKADALVSKDKAK
jgi:ABC-type uncharacterized transport system ATPase component